MQRNDPAWIEVDLDAIKFNAENVVEFVRGNNSKTKVLGVIKADAYGHGAIEVAKIMIESGINYFGVATIYEALELRNSGIKDFPILNFSYTPPAFYEKAIKNNITMTVYSYEMAKEINKIGQEIGIIPKIHIKVDTGMARLGFLPNEKNIEEIIKIKNLNIKVEGIYTHFAMADSQDKVHTHNQAKVFMWILDELKNRGVEFEIRHMCNSAAMMEFLEYYLDMVRAGGILYGHFCLMHYMQKSPILVKQCLSIKALLSNYNEFEGNTGVSYGWFYKTNDTQVIGTIPIGYADGISRKNTNNAEFLIKGKRVNQVGLICMDQMMIDITSIEAPKIGDVVTLLGKDGEEIITLEERAKAASIGKCELFASIGRRLPKLYFKGNEFYKKISYL